MISNNLILEMIDKYEFVKNKWELGTIEGSLTKDYLLSHKNKYRNKIEKLTQLEIDVWLKKPLALVYFYITEKNFFLLHGKKTEFLFLYMPKLKDRFFSELRPTKDGILNLYSGEICWINKRYETYKLRYFCDIDLKNDPASIDKDGFLYVEREGIKYKQKEYPEIGVRVLIVGERREP